MSSIFLPTVLSVGGSGVSIEKKKETRRVRVEKKRRDVWRVAVTNINIVVVWIIRCHVSRANQGIQKKTRKRGNFFPFCLSFSLLHLFSYLHALISSFKNWKALRRPCTSIVFLLIAISVNLFIGLLPYIDNFAHVGNSSSSSRSPLFVLSISLVSLLSFHSDLTNLIPRRIVGWNSLWISVHSI